MSTGYMEIVFPSGFDITAAYCNTSEYPACTATITGQIISIAGISTTADVDSQLTVKGVRNPSNIGGYGPFKLLTRFFAEGQIIDMNSAFGTVGIAEAAQNLDMFSVDLLTSETVGATGGTLSLKFALSTSLWAFDMFKVTIPPLWKIGSAITCRSEAREGRQNFFNGTHVDDINNLDCFVATLTATGQQYVWIYGLGVDLNIESNEDAKYADIRITDVTNPNAAYSDSTWSLETMRKQTRTIINRASQIPNINLSPAQFTQVTYEPTWGLPASEIVEGMTIYMDLKFMVANPVPVGGSVEIILTDDINNVQNFWTQQGSTQVRCYLITAIGNSVCEVEDPNIVKVQSTTSVVSADTQLQFRVLPTFVGAGSHGISSITTKTGDDIIIDQLATISGEFTLSTTGALAQDFKILLSTEEGGANDQNMAGGEVESSRLYFKIRFSPSAGASTDANSLMTVTCPMTSTQSDYEFFIPNDFLAKYNKTSPSLKTGAEMDGAGTNLGRPTIDNIAGTISIQFDADNVVESTQEIFIGLVSTSARLSSWPSVATNISTKYECTLEVKTTSGAHPVMRSASVIELIPRDVSTWVVSPQTCGDATDGMLYRVDLSPDKTEFQANQGQKDYYIDVEFFDQAANFNSGITSGQAYPIVCKNAITTSTGVLGSTDDSTLIQIGNMGVFITSQTAQCYFSLGANQEGLTGTYKITGYFQDGSETTEKQILYQKSGTINHTDAAGAFGSVQIANRFDNVKIGLEIIDYTLEANQAQSYAWTSSDYQQVQVLLPAGSTWTDDVLDFNIGANSMENVVKLYSSNKLFKYPTVFGNLHVMTNLIPDSAAYTDLQIGRIQLPFTKGDRTGRMFYGRGDAVGSNGEQCLNNGPFTATLTSGLITLQEINPAAVKGRGAGSVDLSITLKFFTEHDVDDNGQVVIVVDGTWETIDNLTSCVVLGVNGGATCTISGNIFTISDFESFPSMTTIAFILHHIMPPYNGGLSEVKTLVLSITSRNANGDIIDEYANVAEDRVTVHTATLPSSSQIIDTFTLPPNAGEQHVDFYMRFKLLDMVPSQGTITIDFPIPLELALGAQKEFCWLSLKYTSCTVSDQSIVLVLGEKYEASTELELKLDSGVSNPDGTPEDDFHIESVFQSTTLSQTPFTTSVGLVQSVQYSQEGKIQTILSGAISSFVPSTAGERSEYTFNIQSSVAMVPTDKIVIRFPRDFDAFVGGVREEFATAGATSFIQCSAPLMSDRTDCQVSHWNVTVFCQKDITANTDLAITIENIINPVADTETGQFAAYHVDLFDEFISYSSTIGTVTPTAQASNIQVRNVRTSSNELALEAVTYTFELYSDSLIDDTNQLSVRFPIQFDLDLANDITQYPCITSYMGPDDEAVAWNENAICTKDRHQVLMSAPAEAITFSDSDKLTWEVSGIKNPQWGETRQARAGWDFDVTDHSVFPIYQHWTSAFNFFVYSDKEVLQRSYENLNAAYVGYSSAKTTLVINDYEPNTRDNRIVIVPGSQTEDIIISTGSDDHPVGSGKLVLTPETNSSDENGVLLTYTSKTDFTLWEEEFQTIFRVAADHSLIQGLYYINWSLEETRHDGIPRNQFLPPAKTLVEITPPYSHYYSFEVNSPEDSLVEFPVSHASPPIKITVLNSPANEVVIDLSIEGTFKGLVVNPSSIIFGPNINTRYFVIDIQDDFDMSGQRDHKVKFSLNGEDADLYKIQGNFEFTVVEEGLTTSGGIEAWNFQTCEGTKCEFSPEVGEIGILYYQISVKGTECYTLSAMKEVIGSLNELESQPAHNGEKPVALPDETYTEYQRRVFKFHSQEISVSVLSFAYEDDSTTVTLENLWSGTEYQVWGYFENVYGEASAVSHGYFETASSDNSTKYSVRFERVLSQDISQQVINAMSYYQGVDPKRTHFEGRTSDEISTTYIYTMYAEREKPHPSTEVLVPLTDDKLDLLKVDFQTAFQVSLVSMSLEPTIERYVPGWTLSPSAVSTSQTSTRIQGLSNISGEICCIAVPEEIIVLPRPEQVMLHQHPDNTEAPGVCVQTDLSLEIQQLTLSGMEPNSIYSIYCISTDDYPVWPTQMLPTASNPIAMFQVQTLPMIDDDTDDSWARWFSVAWIVLLIST